MYLCPDFMTEYGNKLPESRFASLLNGFDAGVYPDREEWRMLLTSLSEEQVSRLRHQAAETSVARFGHGIYVRGLIEISSFCRNDCFYCGLRRSNRHAVRYRLGIEEILDCCREGARLGFGTFVLQGGEDEGQDDDWIEMLVRAVKEEFPACAVTLSVGERSEEAYRRFREAGADRYLLRHETRNEAHYARLHPSSMSAANRRECLRRLKGAGFQTGAGMMVGSPGQTTDCLLDDIQFLEELQPEMIGMGPFIPAAHTPFARHAAGSTEQTLLLMALMRLRFPRALIPATTALATLSPRGRMQGILSGANVVMPNLSPETVWGQYAIYDRKLCEGGESARRLGDLERELETIGYHIAFGRGDYPEK